MRALRVWRALRVPPVRALRSAVPPRPAWQHGEPRPGPQVGRGTGSPQTAAGGSCSRNGRRLRLALGAAGGWNEEENRVRFKLIF